MVMLLVMHNYLKEAYGERLDLLRYELHFDLDKTLVQYRRRICVSNRPMAPEHRATTASVVCSSIRNADCRGWRFIRHTLRGDHVTMATSNNDLRSRHSRRIHRSVSGHH